MKPDETKSLKLFQRLLSGDTSLSIYDKKGNQITIEQYLEFHDQMDYTSIASDLLGGYIISTVWLGIDHGTVNKHMIFETMVFETHKPLPIDKYTRRYSTEEEAKAGHSETRLSLMLKENIACA